jgi:ATP-dependent RNA helicase DHX37/DHR1
MVKMMAIPLMMPPAANTLVLPSLFKRATKIISKDKTITRILSKKQRKKLEKVVEQKKKKENVSTTIIDNKAQPV